MKDLELAKLRTDLASSKKWCSELESQVSALQGTNLKLLEDQRVTEGRMMEGENGWCAPGGHGVVGNELMTDLQELAEV